MVRRLYYIYKMDNRILLKEHSLFLLIQECRDNVMHLAPSMLVLLMFLRKSSVKIIIFIIHPTIYKKN